MTVTPPARCKGADSETTMIETDYLVVGAGASGLIFADEMLTHSDAHIGPSPPQASG